MSFIPPRPTIATPNLAPLPRVRPSGTLLSADAQWGTFGTPESISIAAMPPDADVFADGTALSTVGAGWDGTTAHFPMSNAFTRLRVVSPSQGTRESVGNFGARDVFNWDTMPRVEGVSSAPTVLRVVSMPPGGQVYINGTPVDGRWVGNEWEVPVGPVVSSLRIADASGNSRSRTEASQTAVLAGRLRTSWADLTPDSAQVRVVGPHVVLFIDDVQQGRPNAEDAAGNIRRYDIPLGPHTIKVRAEDGYEWTFPVNVPAGTAQQLMLIRPAAPPPRRMDVGGIGTGTATGTLRIVGGRPGWTAALARSGTPPTPIGAVTLDGTGSFTQPNLPAGDYILLVGRPGADNMAPQTRTFPIAGGQTVVADVGTYFPPAPAAPAFNTRLTVLGVPGMRLAIANRGSLDPLVPPVVIPSTGAVETQWVAGVYDLVVAPTDGRPAVGQTIVVPLGVALVDTRSWVPAAGSPPATNPPATNPPPAGSVNLTITGTPEWRVTLTPTGTTAFVWRGPILASGTGGAVVVPVAPGSYELTVEDGAGHSATRTVSIGAGGGTVDTAPYLASALRTTQGPTAPAAGTGAIVLSGAPPGSTVRAVGVPDWTVDTTGRPVEFNVAPGTYGVTVVPPSGPQRVGSAIVTAGGSAPLAYGSMATPSSVTAGDNPGIDSGVPNGTGLQPVTPVEQMCGPIVDKPAWAPATACPGATLTAPDGSRYAVSLAPAGTTGVILTKLKADGTPDTGMAGTTKLLIAGGLVAAAAVAWYAWQDSQESKGKGAKVENPSKKCSCQSH